MWLHVPRTGEVGEPGFSLASDFRLWMLLGGKPQSVHSSEVDWKKSKWTHVLDLWEPLETREARVRDHLAAVASPSGPDDLRVLGLCAGYGGLERALHLAIPSSRTVGFVERQAYAAAVLAARMKEGLLHEAPIWDDLETFDCTPWRGCVDIVCAGFPCQGASVAGKRRGTDDERWLWPEVWRITKEVGACWLFIENVPGLLSVNGGVAFEEIVRDLGASWGAAEWDCLSAATTGAPHLRDRLFLLAADAERVAVRIESKRKQWGRRGARATLRRNAKFDDDGTHRDSANADRGNQPPRTARNGADTDGAGRARERCSGELDGSIGKCGSHVDRRGGPPFGHTLDIVGRILELGRAHWDWGRAPQPCIRGVAHESAAWLGDGADDPAYADKLHLLGNGVVETCAAVALANLWERLHGTAIDVRRADSKG